MRLKAAQTQTVVNADTCGALPAFLKYNPGPSPVLAVGHLAAQVRNRSWWMVSTGVPSLVGLMLPWLLLDADLHWYLPEKTHDCLRG